MKKFLIKIGGSSVYRMGEQIGLSEKELNVFQLERLGVGICCLFVGVGLIPVIGLYGPIVFSGLALLLWVEKKKELVRRYKRVLFTRQVSFSKFCRMLIPYLLAETQGKSLYAIFSHLANRLTGESIQEPLYRLIASMNDCPNEIEPFVEFAESCSGTDEAVNFMTTLYYYQQSSEDPTIIQELGRLANDELFEGVQEIVELKVKRLSKYPLYLVFSLGIPMLGIMSSFVWRIVQTNLLLK